MALEIFMPRLTHDMDEGLITRWIFQEGAHVHEGDIILEVETNKAITDIEAEASGILGGIRYFDGESVPIGKTIAFIYDSEEEWKSAKDNPSDQDPVDDLAVSQDPNGKKVGISPSEPFQEAEPVPGVLTSPVAKKLALSNNIDLSGMQGSGPGGKIVKDDVLAQIEKKNQKEPKGKTENYIDVSVSKIKRITGERMLESVTTQPTFSLEIDVDMQELVMLRSELNTDDDRRVSLSSLIVFILVRCLTKFPLMNATFQGETIRQYQDINMGIAMASPAGLVVPVIQQAQNLNISDIQDQLSTFREKADQARLKLKDLVNGTFTFSNLGMFGVDRFTAIINPPEAAILTTGRIREIPWNKNGKIEINPVMTLRLTIDHRVLDGAEASDFLGALRLLLEDPSSAIL